LPTVDQLPVPTCQYIVSAVVNVIPVFPPASPEPPVIPDKSQLPAPAPVMSWKSVLVTTTVPAVSVRAVPRVFDLTSILFVAELPLIVRVPVMV